VDDTPEANEGGLSDRAALAPSGCRVMTENEWLSSTDPQPMLEFIEERTTNRKLRLFACACCRVLRLASHPRSAWVLEIAEKQADGEAGLADWKTAFDIASAAANDDQAADLALEALFFYPDVRSQLVAMAKAVASHSLTAIDYEAWASVKDPVRPHRDSERAFSRKTAKQAQARNVAVSSEKAGQVSILHDLIGNPLHPFVIDPTWLIFHNGAVPGIAQGIYATQEFEHLPILADALEDAGCTDAAILEHLRGPGPHYRGCFVIDAILGKK
jgi:hypothetical protein